MNDKTYRFSPPATEGRLVGKLPPLAAPYEGPLDNNGLDADGYARLAQISGTAVMPNHGVATIGGGVAYGPYGPNLPNLFPPPGPQKQEANPKTLMGRLKVPMLSVIPPAALIREAVAMQYGAFEAKRKDGGVGYGPYNWRDQPIEYMVYVDAAMRHLMAAVDGEDYAQDSKACHLAHARATLGILIDAIENETVIDNRPKVRKQVATKMFERLKKEAA